tara:strand:+ start:184 stop:444 length:261 start_codon:yes stop_codon:yes gene_type:complete
VEQATEAGEVMEYKEVMQYKIEKNIPIPYRNKMLVLASEMDVGDSIFFEGQQGRSRGNNLCANLQKLELDGCVRKVEGGYRVWRTK